MPNTPRNSALPTRFSLKPRDVGSSWLMCVAQVLNLLRVLLVQVRQMKLHSSNVSATEQSAEQRSATKRFQTKNSVPLSNYQICLLIFNNMLYFFKVINVSATNLFFEIQVWDKKYTQGVILPFQGHFFEIFYWFRQPISIWVLCEASFHSLLGRMQGLHIPGRGLRQEL